MPGPAQIPEPAGSAPAAADHGAGAFVDAHGVAHFRVWAPQARAVDVVIDRSCALELARVERGYFEGSTDRLPPGSLYKYRIDGAGPWPDPFSRFQPEGPHGPSQLVQPSRYPWNDQAWPGVTLAGQVVYELHVGTFTEAGTFDAAQQKLQWLRGIGVTLIELMPIAEFPGRWNWGYDGVQLYAPYHGYGDHEALKRFVDAAHSAGLGVILDVVYNHLGPDGNYLRCFSPHYFSAKHSSDWGESLNFDGDQCEGARELIAANPSHWVREFHVDGFRLDATHAILDDSEENIVAALVLRTREAASPRSIVFMAENEPQDAEHLQSAARGGQGLDAMWNDDFHHAARVALTGSRDGYFYDFTGRSQELLSAIRRGFLFQGQRHQWQKKRRGSLLRDVPAASCVHFLQNHDQVGNTYRGLRLSALATPGQYRALTALLLLGPQTPLLFMGQEFGSSSRFEFFAEHVGELGKSVANGRREFLRQFRAYESPEAQAQIADPNAESTFRDSKLHWNEAQTHQYAVDLHRDLLTLRRTDPLIASQDWTRIDGATLSEKAFLLRWFDSDSNDRLLVVNLDGDLPLESAPEPLLAPSAAMTWSLVWSSESPRYGGSGAVSPVNAALQWRIPAHSATLLRNEPL